MSAEYEEQYFVWLCAKVTDSSTSHQPYYELYRQMHQYEFVWVLPGDANRVGDVIDLRVAYRHTFHLSQKEFEKCHPEPGASVFEVLIAFLRHAEFQTQISEAEWFHTFIENLGLEDEYDAGGVDEQRVDSILYNFVWRTYEPDGTGGIFPIRIPLEDQRKVEIWFQFFEYLESEMI